MQLVAWRAAETLVERIAALRSRLVRDTAPPRHPSEIALERNKRWRAQFTSVNPHLFAQRLAADRITEDEFMRVLEEPEASSSNAAGDYPSWLRTLDDAYSPASSFLPDFANISRDLGSAYSPFLRAIEPIIRHVVNRFREGAMELGRDHQTAPFDPQAVHRLFTGSLLRSLSRMLAPTMILELNVARLQNELKGGSASARFKDFIRRLEDRAFALQILRAHPVLSRQVVLQADAWLKNNLAFLRNLSHDWRDIVATFSPRADPGRLVAIQTQLGDSHRGGRSVLVTRFSCGLRVVYKPRALDLDAHFQEFLQWINCRIKELGF
jgi:lantibiotic modifying enzyme